MQRFRPAVVVALLALLLAGGLALRLRARRQAELVGLLAQARAAAAAADFSSAHALYQRASASGPEARLGVLLSAQGMATPQGAPLTGVAAAVGFTAGKAALVLSVAQGTATVRDASTGKALLRIEHGGPIAAASLQHGLVVTRDAARARIWSGEGRPLLALDLPAGADLAVAEDARGAVVYDRGLWVIALPSGDRLRVSEGPAGGRLSLKRFLAAVRLPDGALELWSTVDRKLVAHREGVGADYSMAPDATQLAWSDAAGLHLATVSSPADVVLSPERPQGFAWSEDSRLLATCGDGPGRPRRSRWRRKSRR